MEVVLDCAIIAILATFGIIFLDIRKSLERIAGALDLPMIKLGEDDLCGKSANTSRKSARTADAKGS